MATLEEMKELLRRLDRVFLTARRMVSNVLASKLPARKSSAQVVNKHGRLGNLKMPGPSSISDESVVSRRKNGKFLARKRTVQCSMGTKLAEKGRKMIFERERRKV